MRVGARRVVKRRRSDANGKQSGNQHNGNKALTVASMRSTALTADDGYPKDDQTHGARDNMARY